MLKNVPISLSGPVMNIKILSFKATLGGYNNLIGGIGRNFFLHNKLQMH